MKRATGLIIVLAIAGICVATLRKTPTRPSTEPLPSPTNSMKPQQYRFIELDGVKIAYMIMSAHPDAVTLIPNFEENKTASQIMADYACTAGINGGFYDTQFRPLGLFVYQNQPLAKEIQSALFNGFITISADQTVSIDFNLPNTHNRIALQTGPMLVANGSPLTLRIHNDEYARRMVAAKNTNDELIFLAVFDEHATYSGPLLAQLPYAIKTINEKELLHITDAINLDGGSASAFMSKTASLQELKSVGSMFCIQQAL